LCKVKYDEILDTVFIQHILILLLLLLLPPTTAAAAAATTTTTNKINQFVTSTAAKYLCFPSFHDS